ncbi:methyl-accepting chemotaxis protein [Cohnella lupini]|uniref:Methyl-accepting chemotaxis protein n=1 Tax=Cohnella lupini TaxID=1294267 RepID=A0A3D9INC4_9BACL|nr:methyl-accepting chemotaxis protein [Cohnella lupini]RED63273.1 methyl-accepting chemotaxis protein [Cohnella lupini]
MRNWSFGTKISLIVIGILLAFSTVIAYVAIGQMQNGIKAFAVEKARSDLELVNELLIYKYPGDWEIKGGSLFKGDTKMNGNSDIVDGIGNITGDTVTIFQADIRVATNVMKEGQRAVGTAVSEQINDAVLKKGENFYGEANVVGQIYQAAYQPIRNADGEIIGILYIGAPQNVINGIISSFIKNFTYVIGAAIIVSILLILWYIRRMKKRIGLISNAMENAGLGNFTTIIKDKTGDEIGKLGTSFNAFSPCWINSRRLVLISSEKVVASSKQLKTIGEQTTKESKQIIASIEQVAAGAEIQTSSTEENLKAMEEVSIGIQRIAENASSISESALISKVQAETGGEYVHKTVQQMNAINHSVQETDNLIKLLDDKSRAIAEILQNIRAISGQTNILALNAAIEAVRAGEQGRGFAIVSQEVRKLAEQSGLSSDRIADLIQEMTSDMKRSIDAMAQVIREVRTGIDFAHELDRNFNQIVHSNVRISSQIEEMAGTAEQISAGVQEITASVSEIARIANVTSSSSHRVVASSTEQLGAIEQIGSSSASLSEVSNELQKSLAKFKI